MTNLQVCLNISTDYIHSVYMRRIYLKISRRKWISLLTVVLLASIPKCGCKVPKGSSVCEKFDGPQCTDESGACATAIEDCANVTASYSESSDDSHNHMLCFASWLFNGTHNQLLKKGCWLNQNKCYDQRMCVENRYSAAVYFCCCDGDMCNKEYYHIPEMDHEPLDQQLYQVITEYENKSVYKQAENQLTKTLLYSIVPIIGVGVLVVALFFLWRRHQHHMGHTQLPTLDPSLASTPSRSSLNLQLLELRARGRYGSLWKAQLPDQDNYKICAINDVPSSLKYVAVKIFPLQDKQSWMTELDIYNLPHMKHENILSFIAPEKREDKLTTELWLITEFHDIGSLCDYLKRNTVTWTQLCKIGESMTCGLAYLHDEIPASYNSLAKPAIAHRDFKSKNVLLKHDLTACIADFGLALKFEPGKCFNETHPQVGTRRYMAPEVLEGAICFNLDSFLRIDMYACGLIIWELMTRCSSIDGPVVNYRLPFEAEVGLQPTVEEMQALVVTQKIRPVMNSVWHKHPGLNSLIPTVEECWDQESEARLSAGCVKERFGQLARTINSGSGLPSNDQLFPISPYLPCPASNTCDLSTAIISNGGSLHSFVEIPNDPVSCAL